MGTSQRKLAKSLGVSKTTIVNAKKSLGIMDETLNEEQERMVIEEASKTVKLKESVREKTKVKSKDFKPNVRRIDKSDSSSVEDMLKDCKEQYVMNQGLIERLMYEIDNQEILMHGNSNGTLSGLPQLGILEKFQKVNITLRNQIVSLENELGRFAEEKKEDSPFD